MAKKKNSGIDPLLMAPASGAKGSIDPQLLYEILFELSGGENMEQYPGSLDTEGGETKWPKQQRPISRGQEADSDTVARGKGDAGYQPRPTQKSSTSGGGSSSLPDFPYQPPESLPGASSSSGEILDPDFEYYQSLYDYSRHLDPKDKFTFDDTYAADTEGYRDFGGYLMDLGKVGLGAFGASEKLTEYTPSSDFRLYQDEARRRRSMGLDPTTRSVYQSGAERVYNYDIKNIRNLSGGSGGAALANLGGASERFYDSQNQLALLNEQMKQQHQAEFAQSALAGEQVNRQIFEDERQIQMLNKQFAGELMSDSMDNILHRKEYEDTYLKPGSPYYEYMKELTLDTRMNRELKQFSEEQRVKQIDQFALDYQNEMQEYMERTNTGREAIGGTFEKYIQDNGGATTISSAEDFKKYNGQPVIDINDPNNRNMWSTVDKREQFGLTKKEMDQMTDQELSDQGIERTENTYVAKGPDGEERTVTTYNYGRTEPMEGTGERSENDPELSDTMDNIGREYSKKRKDLMDKYYLTDEKKYNKLVKELDEEEKKKREQAKNDYLQNGSKKKKNNYMNNVERARILRPVARQNEDGTVSTVVFEQSDNLVYPTIFPKDPNNPSPNPEDWIELEGEEAYQEAKKRGEIFKFNSEDEAMKFAEGDWKQNKK